MTPQPSRRRSWILFLAFPAVFAGGIALGIFHATGHGGGGTGVHAPAAHVHGDAPATPGPPSATAIRDEMIALQAAYDTLNRAVVLGDARGVAEAFHQVHARKQDTEAAIASGVARPPRNGDRMEAFVARDRAFHSLLETTVEAAGRGDLETLRRTATELRDGCIACHEEFRGVP